MNKFITAFGCAAVLLAASGYSEDFEFGPQDSVHIEKVIKAATAAESAWPGYRVFDIPFLSIHAGKSAAVIGYSKALPGFDPIRIMNRRVLISSSNIPNIGFMFGRKYKLFNISMTAVQYADDTPEGNSVLMGIHEHFHDFQASWSEPPGDVSYAVENATDVALATIEQELLARALESPDAAVITQFVAIRQYRYSQFPVSDAERSHERSEGTAKFIENSGRRRAFGRRNGDNELLSGLRKPLTAESMGRWRNYYTGAAMCYLLDISHIDKWRSAVESGQGPYDLLLKRFGTGTSHKEKPLASVFGSVAYEKAFENADAMLTALRARKDAALHRFAAESGIRIQLKDAMAAPAGQTTFSAASEFHIDQETLLFDPVVTFHFNATGWECDVQNQMILFGRNIEFVVPSTAALTLDGTAWFPLHGAIEFKKLVLKSAYASVTVLHGRLEFDGTTLMISRP